MTYMVNGRQYIVVAVGWSDMPAEWGRASAARIAAGDIPPSPMRAVTL